METKIVFQTDHRGFYVGTTLADESPLEPGVFHIPGGCVETAPPEYSASESARWDGENWVIEQLPPETIPDLPEAPGPITRDDVEAARLLAYSNPLTGSDRLFAEASRMDIMGEPDFEAVRASAIARYQEIQAANPWPDQ